MANGAPSEKGARVFDAGKRKAEREAREFILAGNTFHPTPNNTKLRAKLRTLSAEHEDAVKELLENAQAQGDAEGDELKKLRERYDKVQEMIEDIVLRQVIVRLVDDAGKEPTKAFMNEHFDLADADAFFDWFNEAEEESGPDPS